MREVGPGARSIRAAWVRDLRDQCAARGIPFFWETTAHDDPDCLAERRRAAQAAAPYQVQP